MPCKALPQRTPTSNSRSGAYPPASQHVDGQLDLTNACNLCCSASAYFVHSQPQQSCRNQPNRQTASVPHPETPSTKRAWQLKRCPKDSYGPWVFDVQSVETQVYLKPASTWQILISVDFQMRRVESCKISMDLFSLLFPSARRCLG